MNICAYLLILQESLAIATNKRLQAARSLPRENLMIPQAPARQELQVL
jgi:hypothetical protein